MKNISRKIIYSLALAVVVYLILAAWGVKNGLLQAFTGFNWRYLPLLLVIAFSNYLVRFIKWQYYLKILRIKIPPIDSFIIFISGLSLTITPGKLGEVVKSYFLKTGFNVPVSRTAPIVFADRLADLMAFLTISAIGAYGFSYGKNVIWIIFFLIVAVILVILIRPVGLTFFRFLTKIKFVSKHANRIMDLYETSYNLLLPKRIIFPFFVSIIAWSFEALDFYLILVLLKLNISVFAGFFVYCFSTIIGAVMMLPAGLGVTDGSIAGLLKFLSINSGTAAFATILIRAVTLWFAVIVGTFFLLVAERRFGKKSAVPTESASARGSRQSAVGKVKMLFHVHTNFSSDGRLTPEDIVGYCRENKITIVAICDHNEIAGALAVKKIAAGNPLVIIGEEIRTPEGEIIGLFLEKKIAKFTLLAEAIEEIKRQGGLVCLPHPGDTVRRSAINRELSEKIINQIDIVEIFNSRNLFQSANNFAENLAEKYHKPKIVAGDAHLKIELPRSLNILDDFKTKSELKKSLKSVEIFGQKSGILIQTWSKILKIKRKLCPK
ncbi:MAG: flippase-like domain-containing protein [Candidatus Berkelbacteria bacterium]|nr:flippase-like domain-containing protein [Candidatus Berkelbacteria bacterium]